MKWVTNFNNFSITVVDNQNVYAEAIDVIIVLCTGCSEHGSCDFTTFRQDNVTTETFKIATCNCSKYWEGMYRICPLVCFFVWICVHWIFRITIIEGKGLAITR